VAKAQGRAAGRFEAILGLVGVLTLAISYSLLTGWNPVSGFTGWLDRLSNVSDPAPAWNVRVGGQPHEAVAGSGAALIIRDDYIEARDLASGDQRWRLKASWAAAAGSSDGPPGLVAVLGRSRGYDVYDMYTGGVRWHGEADASAVWTYRSMIVSLGCPKSDQCLLIGHDLNGHNLWTAKLPGAARELSGANPGLAGLRELTAGMGDETAAMPRRAPEFMALPFEDKVVVIDASSGVQVREVKVDDRRTRVAVIGNQMLTIKAVHQDSGCRYTVRAVQAIPEGPTDPTSWDNQQLDFGTADGIGCEQTKWPVGDGHLIRVLNPKGQQLLISADSGKTVYAAPLGAEILTTDSTRLVQRDPGNKTISLYSVQGGDARWSRAAGKNQDIAITSNAVLILDHPDRMFFALDPVDGRELINVKTRGSFLGYGSSGVLLSEGRSVGYLPFG
jgi:hypothetical protein